MGTYVWQKVAHAHGQPHRKSRVMTMGKICQADLLNKSYNVNKSHWRHTSPSRRTSDAIPSQLLRTFSKTVAYIRLFKRLTTRRHRRVLRFSLSTSTSTSRYGSISPVATSEIYGWRDGRRRTSDVFEEVSPSKALRCKEFCNSSRVDVRQNLKNYKLHVSK